MNKTGQLLSNNDFIKIKKFLKCYYDTLYLNIENKLCYIEKALKEEIKDFLKYSKNIRSIVLFLLCLANDTEIDENIIKIGAITELIHNASIIHDDVVDKAQIRRGKKTFNKKYDNKFACLLGDYILTIAVKEMYSLNSQRIEKYFNRTINHMCLGEINQYKNRNIVSDINNYIIKCIKKTSLLFEAPIYAYCVLYVKEYKKAIKFIKFARYLGIAFQIKDDLNNILDENKQKPLLNDIQNRIYNSSFIYAYNDYPELLKKSKKDIIEIVRKEKYTYKSINLIEKYVNKAENELDCIKESINKEYLFTILNMFML